MGHKVQVNVANYNLPNGFYYQSGATPTLTEEEFAKLNATAISSGHLTDLGVTGPSGDAVTTQGAAVTLTSAQVATANATDLATSEALANSLKTQLNALQADVVALNTALSGAGKALV